MEYVQILTGEKIENWVLLPKNQLQVCEIVTL